MNTISSQVIWEPMLRVIAYIDINCQFDIKSNWNGIENYGKFFHSDWDSVFPKKFSGVNHWFYEELSPTGWRHESASATHWKSLQDRHFHH